MSNPVKQEVVRAKTDAQASDDEELARRFRCGESAAFDGLLHAYQSRIFNLAYRILNSFEDAEETTQEIFVKVHSSIDRFEGRCKFGTWLYAVAVNMCRNRLRQIRRRSSVEVRSLDVPGDGKPLEASTSDAESAPAQMERAEMLKLVERCISELPVEFSSVVVLRDVQGMSYEEVAVALGCSLGTVKSRLARARHAVQEKLRPHLR
jgi:RNA polymerase sigma-70 factor, ECF subfamily